MMTTKAKRLSAAAAIATAIAIPAEGLRQYAYYDPPGILTVCYGSTTNVEKGRKYTLEECKARLDDDMMDAIQTVERFMRGVRESVRRPVSDNQLGAMTSLAYNIGIGAFRRSTLLRLFNAGDAVGAGKQFDRWNKANGRVMKGLIRRRADERAVYEQAPDDDDVRP